MSRNVITDWRRMPLVLKRKGWRCSACARIALVRRRLCQACNEPTPRESVPLPAQGTIVAASRAGVSIEVLNRAQGDNRVVLVDLGGQLRLLCQLAKSDEKLVAGDLVGRTARLCIRRLDEVEPSDVVPYGIKVTVQPDPKQP